MALKFNFYQEIFDKEQTWLISLESNLLNAYYLPELKNFYSEKVKALEYEFKFTGNGIIKNIHFILKNILKKIDYLIEEDKKGNLINFMELNDLFLINKMTNNLSYMNNINLNSVSNKKNNLYELRKKIVNIDSEDYLDDDFYYDEKKQL